MKEARIPRWIIAVCSLICALGIFVGGSLYLSPGSFIHDVNFSMNGTRYLANMWGARQITLASILGYSAFRKSIPMLQLSLAAYCLMNVQDAVIGALRADMGLVVGAALFVVGPALMVFRLSRISR